MKRIFNNIILAIIFLVSSNVVLSQNPCSGTPGSNTVVPISQTICAGNPITLHLLNNDSTSGIQYQWQSSTISPVGPFTNIQGAFSRALTTPTLGSTTFFNIIITCTNSGLSISIPYSVTVIPCNVPCSGTPAATSIVPSNQTVCVGNIAAMSLSNTYTETGITYQWGNSNAPSGPFQSISNATMSSFVSPTISANTYYSVVITCTNSSFSYSTSHAVSAVSCSYCSGAPSSNSILPLSQTVCAGTSVNLSIANSYSASGYTYQWQQSLVSMVGPFQPILGATSSTYASNSLTTTTYFSLVITCTNSGQSITLNRHITVIPCNAPCIGTPASTSILPLSHTLCAGDKASLSLATTYSETGISFQWGSASAPSGPYTPISGAISSSYLSPTLTANSYYNVVITCANSGQSFSTTHSVSVVSCTYCAGQPMSNTILPISDTICAGTTLTLSLANTYTASGLSYQWQMSNTSIVGPFSNIAGATSNTYASSTVSNTTYFNVIITCTNGGQSRSIVKTIYVVSCPNLCVGIPATNSILPISQTICVGHTASLSLANTYSASGITYQWQTSNLPDGPFTSIPHATLSSFTSPALNANTYFKAIITCTNGNQSFTAARTLSVVPCVTSVLTRENLNATEKVLIYPNPSVGDYVVVTSDCFNKTIILRDIFGRIVVSINSTEKEIKVSTKLLPGGLYSLEILCENSTRIFKLLKE